MPSADTDVYDASANAPLIPSNDEHETSSAPDGSPSGGNPFIWILTISACVSGLLFGYDTGVISSTLVSIGTSLSHRSLTDLDKGLITSAVSGFALVASPIGGVLADVVGRKNIIIYSDVLFIIGALWQAFTSTIWGMIAGRAVVGLAIGGASLITPLYISEMAPRNMRGRLITVMLLFITGGQVIAYVIGWALSTAPSGWRWMVGLGAIPAIIQIMLLFGMPETPRYLCKAGREDRAQLVLTKIYAHPSQRHEIASILEAINNEVLATSTKDTTILSTFKSLLTHPPHLRALILTCLLQGLQQLCGFNSLMYFSATLFSDLKFSSPTLTSLAIASTNFLFTLGAFQLIDRLGRRKMLLLTIPVMTVALVGAAGSYSLLPRSHASDVSPNADPPNHIGAYLILVSLITYVAAYALALGPVPWTQSELFPLSVRSLGSSVATATNWTCNTVVGLTFLPMMSLLGPRVTFGCYAVVCAVGWVAICGIYPEMSGLGLEEIGEVLNKGWGVQRSLQLASARRNQKVPQQAQGGRLERREMDDNQDDD